MFITQGDIIQDDGQYNIDANFGLDAQDVQTLGI